MSKLAILEQDKFWLTLKYLLEINGKKSIRSICSEISISQSELNSYLNFLAQLNCIFEVEGEIEKELIGPIDLPEFQVNFSLMDWLEFQAHFPKISENEGSPYHESFSSKMEELERKMKDFSLFEPAMTLEQVLDSQQPKIVTSEDSSHSVLLSLEESIVEKSIINVTLEKTNKEIYPRKIVFFDGLLNLVAEDLTDKSLVNITLDSILRVDKIEDKSEYSETYSRVEIDEFVSSIREMGENLIRLVLKVYSKDKFSLRFDNMYFERPCFFSNHAGDFIWAATVEPSEELYEWLNELGPDVEILDPTSFKLEFLNYCETKLKKLA